MGQPRVLWAAAAVLVVAAAALWLVPLALNRSTQSPPKAAPAPATEVAAQKQPNATAPVSAATPAAPVSTAPASPETATVPPGPAAAEPEPPPAPPGPAAEPPAATTGTVSPTPAAVPNETTVANFRNHVQTLLAKKDAEQALSVLTEALAYAPADKGLRALSPKVLDQARARASQERTKALAQRVSGRPKFKEAERTMQQCADARPRPQDRGIGPRVFRRRRYVRQCRGRRGRGRRRCAGRRRSDGSGSAPNPSLLPQLRRRNPIRRPPVPK